MAGVGVRIEGMQPITDKMRKAVATAPRELDKALMRGALLVAGQAQRNVTAGGTGLHVRTGRLRQSIGISLIAPGVARVGTNVIYAAIHEFGGKTKAHIIKPKTAGGILAFKGSASASFIKRETFRLQLLGHGGVTRRSVARRYGVSTSGMVFRREVHHPGSNIPPRPYMRPALQTMRSRVIAEIRKVYAGPLGLGEVGRG